MASVWHVDEELRFWFDTDVSFAKYRARLDRIVFPSRTSVISHLLRSLNEVVIVVKAGEKFFAAVNHGHYHELTDKLPSVKIRYYDRGIKHTSLHELMATECVVTEFPALENTPHSFLVQEGAFNLFKDPVKIAAKDNFYSLRMFIVYEVCHGNSAAADSLFKWIAHVFSGLQTYRPLVVVGSDFLKRLLEKLLFQHRILYLPRETLNLENKVLVIAEGNIPEQTLVDIANTRDITCDVPPNLPWYAEPTHNVLVMDRPKMRQLKHVFYIECTVRDPPRLNDTMLESFVHFVMQQRIEPIEAFECVPPTLNSK